MVKQWPRINTKLSMHERTAKTFASNLGTQTSFIQEYCYFLLLFENHLYLKDQTLQSGD